jgi:hypothetical protein
MKKPRLSSYPMPMKDVEELARELSEFGYRETDDPDDAKATRFVLSLWPGRPLAEDQEPSRTSGEARSRRRLGHQAMATRASYLK